MPKKKKFNIKDARFCIEWENNKRENAKFYEDNINGNFIFSVPPNTVNVIGVDPYDKRYKNG